MNAEADEIIGLYRRHARAWSGLRGTILRERKWLYKFIRMLPRNSSVLDLGCGSGRPIGQYLYDSGFALTGVDASPELIQIARNNIVYANWVVADMRGLKLRKKFKGIIAWNSTFHLTPDDQRKMFPVFERHCAKGAVLMFTSGPRQGRMIGKFEGEALYHSSLSCEEYQTLLEKHGFEIIDHVIEDPECGLSTVWLARYKNIKVHQS